jgi:hypothetical protein
MSDEEKQKGCWQKKRFYSEDIAKYTAKLQRKRYGQLMKVYRCPFCEFWHLTREKEQEVKE